ncbi:Acg family FMN-binding oxidoreductase [Rhodohalobacter mucosus]|uniref:Nitroreductase family protein n=1 Tax=Rhodohalobacter mucosus TaxID=2079485 RepID=A0A316TT65_9BACT|nr:hypothetical protein [Rhodohalobacter mucosus]PWN06529.1 hypothetical protein DDZ15_08390 [Rhodohalobacter mucosus]
MDTRDLIYYSTLAPSGHNTQPWKFSVQDNIIRIYPDFDRTLSVVDPDNHALYISLGCALENLVISAKEDGSACRVGVFPDDENEECLRVTLTDESPAKEKDLYEAIPVRQSNRSMYDEQKIPPADMEKLLQANEQDTVVVKTFDAQGKDVDPVIELVKEAGRIQFNDDRFVEELISWIRFNKKEVQNNRDGLSAKVMGFPNVPRWLGRFIMKTFVTADREAEKTEKQIRSSSHLFLFICKKNDKKHWVDAGRGFQRVALTAASLGIAHAHLNMPCEVESVRKKLSAHLDLHPDEQPVLLIRLGYASRAPRSPRRPPEEVRIDS